jgi:ubiquinol-cytochrome c reductase cytochrome c subunit
MTRHPTRLDFVVAALGTLLWSAAPGVAAQAGATDPERGRQLYMGNGCFTCHGTVGQGGERGAGPKLAPDPLAFEAFKALVRQPREAMPRLDARFVSDEQLQEIHRYLASIPKGPPYRDIPALQSIMR